MHPPSTPSQVHSQTVKLGWVRVCVDDIGIALRQLRHLPVVQILFEDFTHVSGLNLKAIIKCIIISNAILASPEDCQVVREWLADHCPGWQPMSVCNAVRYLGFLFRALWWQPPMEKGSRKSMIESPLSAHLAGQLNLGNEPVGHYPYQVTILRSSLPLQCKTYWDECCHEGSAHVWELP